MLTCGSRGQGEEVGLWTLLVSGVFRHQAEVGGRRGYGTRTQLHCEVSISLADIQSKYFKND